MSRRFGRYLIRDELTDELGRGAFGRVYRAFDPNVNRYVAIKVLSSSSDPDLLARFQDESKTVGRLEHENIVKVYDFDLQDGMPYLVMELLDGETLETIIKTQKVAGRPLRLLDQVEIMFQVAKGLQYAHSENVVHRDIKPGNIMVLPNGTVKVMDFGIARVMNKDGTRRTRQGDVAGTILYMAPEQFDGRDADKRTDIFAYADVYYELLTGEHPFSGKDFAAVMYRITAYDPRPIREKLPECPAELESMIHRLLAKDREIRPERLEEVILETQPVLQRLRREQAVLVAAEIEPLIAAGDLERAQIAIRQVLQWDPLNQVANRWREQIRRERDRRAMRARAESLVREGHEHVAARRFKEAMKSFESALRLDQTNPEIRAIVDQVQTTLDNVQTAGRLVAEARAEIERGQLERAEDKAARAAELDSGNPEAPPLRDRLRQEIRSRREAAILARAESLCRSGEHKAAVAVLDEAEAAGWSGPRIAACRARVESERAEVEKRRRQARFVAALAKAREALYSQRVQEASDCAEALCAEYPEEPVASELLSEVREYLAAQRRLEAINQATQTARLLIKEKRLDNAREVLEFGLRAYPRDTSMTRLMEIVNTLAAAQERARKIGDVVRQVHSLADAGQLDEALHAVDGAIGEFGEETSLVECRRNFQLERDQREYARGLQATIEQGRRLLAEGNPAGAIELLEGAMLQYPGETELALLLSSARGTLAALRESEFVKQHRSQIASLETVEQYGAALALMEAALARYPGNAELLDTAERLRQRLQEQGRKRLFAAHVRRVDEAIQAGNWDSAAVACAEAQLDFPAEAALAEYSAMIQESQQQLAFQQLQSQVRGNLARQDLEAVERQLAATRQSFSQDAAWQTLLREFERYRAYDADLKQATEACACGAYDRAEELLRRWLDTAPDPRAAEMLETASRGRREAEERAQREVEELARLRKEAVIAKRRSDADALVKRGDYQGAIAILDQLTAQHPGQPDIQQDREGAVKALDRQRREAEEQTRRLEEAAIAKGQSDADVLVRQGDYQGAITMLDQLVAQHPGHPTIQRCRETAAQALERQRRDAEEEAGRLEEAAVAKGRSDAAALVGLGEYQRAIVMLDQLAAQHPGHPDIQLDREATVQGLERQSREAEEQARQQQEAAAIDKGRSDADALVRQGDYQGAVLMLDHLAAQYPDYPDIQQDREAAVQALERQRREAEEQARRQREEEAIAKERADANALARQGDYQGAIAILDQLTGQYPDHPDIQQDREAAAQALERQRREAEEQARRQQEEAIAKERADANALARQDDYQGAIAILDQLTNQYPDHPDIQQDREAAAQALERQRRDAEEQVRRQEEAVIADARLEATSLIAVGDHSGALTLLDRLAKQYPGCAEIAQDRDSAARELERTRVEAAISEERRVAARLAEKGGYQAAIAILRRLARKHPGHAGIQEDLDAAKLDRERQQQQAEERTRRQRLEEAITHGRQQAAALVTQCDYEDAIGVLDRLARKYGSHAGIEQDRQTAVAQLERQARAAEELAARQRKEAAIEQARREAAALVENGDCEDAIRALDRLADECPGHPGIRRDREAAQRVLERQRTETEIAQGRQDAAALATADDLPGALAMLERLANRYPDQVEIQRDRESAQWELERQHVAAEEQARRQREDAAIAKARGDSAALIQNGDYQGASALLDWLASQHPDNPGIRQDRRALARLLERLLREAEEQARRERELLAIAKGRQEAGGLMRKGEYQGAMIMLDRLAGQYPLDSGIRADRDAAEAAWEQQRRESEERAKRALAAFSARPREAVEQVFEPTEGGAIGQSTSSSASRPVEASREDAEQRAQWALAVFAARKRVAQGQGDATGSARLSNWSRVAGIWKYRLLLILEGSKRALLRFTAGVIAEGRHFVERLHHKG